MQLFGTRKKISEVFTPRRHEVNKNMYVERPSLERSLCRAAEGSQHILLYGESGNGKSWLYRKVFDTSGIKYFAANCANASRFQSLTREIVSIAYPEKEAEKTGYTETKEAGVNAGVASGKLVHEGNYEYVGGEQLLEAFERLSLGADENPVIIVLENLESIFQSSDLMGELANILLLLDDPRYAVLNVKFLIVGTPAGVLDYFSRTKNLESVSNRIVELPKVDGLNQEQVLELVKKGFVDALKINLTDEELNLLAKKIFHITMGVAQRVHEYCAKLAYQIEDNGWNYSQALFRVADLDWLMGGLRQSYTVLENSLNSRDTAVARRNQVIYAVGRLSVHQFDSGDIEKIIRAEFPETVPQTNMGIGSILTELSASESPLLVRNDKTGQFRVRDPRYIMCIRVALFKDKSTGKVKKKKFKNG